MARTKNLADILFPIESNNDEEILNIPPEKRRLHTETYDFSISTIYEHLKNGHIYVPSFQRGYVWSRAQASRLIESLIIQCPIPVIYLAQQGDEKLAVVDGNQRLNSIQLFIDNQFELQGLTTYPELDGLTFESLDPRFQRHISNRTLRCIVILKETHPQIKFDVFERLNTGSNKLNAQELRHGMYHGKLINLIDDIASDKHIQKIIGIRDNKRMKIQESILRFFAYHDEYEHYTKPQVSFLNAYTEKNRNISATDVDQYKIFFQETLEKTQKLFGEYAFKMLDENGDPVSAFNSALFDAQMIAVAKIEDKTVPILNEVQRTGFKQQLAQFLNQDSIKRTLVQSTTDETAVKFRISSFISFIRRVSDAIL